MARKRTSAPASGELFDRGALGRAAKPALPRRARGGRAAKPALNAEEEAELSGPISPARDLDPRAPGPSDGPLSGPPKHKPSPPALAPPLVESSPPSAAPPLPADTELEDSLLPAAAARPPSPDEDDEHEVPALQAPLILTGPRPTPATVPAGPVEHDLEFAGGIHLTNTVLWCDCDRRRDLSFISHAHMEFVGKNRRILATDKTLKILTRGSGKVDALTSPYRRRFTLGPLELELHPAGHVLGSAQLLVERAGRRIVYTHDVCTRTMATVERARPVECDILAIPATYGLPLYRFPPREEVAAGIRAFVERALSDGATPVLFAETIGLAQEVMRIVGEAGFKLRVQGSIYDVAKIYVEFGISLPNARRFGGTPGRDEVVVFPPILRKHAAIRKLKKLRTAIVSGRAAEPGFAFTQRVDEAFALGDAVDHDELLTFIRDTGARDVYLTGGFVEELAVELRARGVRVLPLVAPQQLSLSLKL
jgi:putative mRNA 3-end processing factor